MIGPTQSKDYVAVVRDWIVNGEYPPGSALREDHLARRLAASRTTVRKVMSMIRPDTLVVYIPNRGYFVAQMDHGEVQKRVRVRAALEGLICRVVASRPAAPDLIDQLKRVLERCLSYGRTAHLAEAPMGAYLAAVAEFHRVLQAASENDYLVSLLGGCSLMPVATRAGWRWRDQEEYVTEKLPELIGAAIIDRERVVEAIARGEGLRAETLMREHFYAVSVGIRRLFESGQLNQVEVVRRHVPR